MCVCGQAGPGRSGGRERVEEGGRGGCGRSGPRSGRRGGALGRAGENGGAAGGAPEWSVGGGRGEGTPPPPPDSAPPPSRRPAAELLPASPLPAASPPRGVPADPSPPSRCPGSAGLGQLRPPVPERLGRGGWRERVPPAQVRTWGLTCAFPPSPPSLPLPKELATPPSSGKAFVGRIFPSE